MSDIEPLSPLLTEQTEKWRAVHHWRAQSADGVLPQAMVENWILRALDAESKLQDVLARLASLEHPTEPFNPAKG